MQSVYLCVIFHEKHKEKIPLAAAVVLRRSKAFKNRFEITATYQKLSITRFPLLKCTTVGV